MLSEMSEALAGYMEAITTYKAAEAKCGYDRGYFLSGEREDVERAERRFSAAILDLKNVEVER